MNTKQLKWAAQHDWFISMDIALGEVVVRHDELPNATITFNDFEELYYWAGY